MDNPAQLSPEWLCEMDRNLDKVIIDRTNQVRNDLQNTTTQTSSNEQLFFTNPRSTREGASSQLQIQHDTNVDQSWSSEGAVLSEEATLSEGVNALDAHKHQGAATPSGLKRSPQSNKGQYESRYLNEVLL